MNIFLEDVEGRFFVQSDLEGAVVENGQVFTVIKEMARRAGLKWVELDHVPLVLLLVQIQIHHKL